MRSGTVGRKSLGSLPKKLVQEWFVSREAGEIFKNSIGNEPSLADVIKMVHPKPATQEHESLYGYLIDKKHTAEQLPEIVREFEAYKKGARMTVPKVPFQMLTALELGEEEWREIARNASWQMTRMNLNTFARHGVFKEHAMTKKIAQRLASEDEVRKSKVFPYQLLVAYFNVDSDVPEEVREALQDAMEHAIKNVPSIDGKVVVCPDVSGSMSSAITGARKGSTSAVRCIDVAGLIAAAAMRKNPGATVLPFECNVVDLRLNPRDTVMTNARKLAEIGGGGTNCSAPLALLNKQRAHADLVIFVSDNESWVDAGCGRGTALMQEWSKFKARNPNARLVCIDIQPYSTTQAQEREDILNIGGFSDQVFEVIGQFARGQLNSGHFAELIGKIEI
jgi:60 kDa SS-A/Ro ribonucleoprotein